MDTSYLNVNSVHVLMGKGTRTKVIRRITRIMFRKIGKKIIGIKFDSD